MSRMLSWVIIVCAAPSSRAQAAEPTFTRDVAPVLQRNCQACHRPSKAAPFSMLTYDQVRPWAKAIKEAVLERKMPPWFADPQFGRFANNPALARADIDT